MTPSKQAAIYDSYAAAIPTVTDRHMLDELANRALGDMTLTDNQRDALEILFEVRSRILESDRLHRGPS